MFSFFAGGSTSNAVRTIDRLLSRVQHSTVIDEKIDALQQLAGLPLLDVSECRVSEVLTKALIDGVENDDQRDEEDVYSEMMKTLEVLTCGSLQKTQGSVPEEDDKVATECFEKNVDMMLSFERLFATFQICLSESRSIGVRLFTLRLILNALKFQPSRVQEQVLSHSGFVKSVVETLTNSAEILRNESILVLEAFVEENPTIQNIAVFDGIFELLLAIVSDEGGCGVVACDCYRLIVSLLRGSDSNVKYFGELGCILRIPKILALALKGLSESPNSNDGISISPTSESHRTSSKSPGVVVSFELLVSVISESCRINGAFQSLFFSPQMADVLYQSIVHDLVSSEMKSALLRVVGRSLLGCKTSCSVFSDFKLRLRSLSMFHLKLAISGADIGICSNALFVLESFFYMNETAQISAVSTLTPDSDSVSDRLELFGSDLIQPLSRWQNDMKCLSDFLLFWTTSRILVIITRRNVVAKQIAVNTALSEPIDERPPPRLLDIIIRSIQVAFDSSYADARVRVAFLLLLSELLVQSQETAHTLLQASHFIETLLAGKSWKSSDPIISGLTCLIWAFCLDVADSVTYSAVLHRIIVTRIGVDIFKSSLINLCSVPDFQNPRPETLFEPASLVKLHLFDSYFVEQANRVIDLCDSHILALVISRDECSDESQMIPSSLISDELIAARSKIEELESDLASALQALADKTDEAALTRYRLDLAQKELSNGAKGSHHPSFDELQHDYFQLQSEHAELKSQNAELLVLLASLESERDLKTMIQKVDERIEQSQNEFFLI